ncbi:MAG TPA: hypothetical protein VJ654_13005 [Noviherbaspirillum sp.]|nr:hypothetical protein [Noviherbaspirillum sp.]
MNLTRANLLKIAGAAIALIALLITFGYRIGRADAKQDIEHIQLLWPDVLTLNVDDRKVLAEAAYRCKLRNESFLPEATKSCLRDGASSIDAEHPEIQASKRLESLIAVARQ